MKIAVFAIISAAALSGCVSEKTTLTNSAGKQMHCDNWGFGVVGTPVAMAAHHHCVEQAHDAGYWEYVPPKAQSKD